MEGEEHMLVLKDQLTLCRVYIGGLEGVECTVIVSTCMRE